MTARCAAEQNRDLYAVPGNVTNKNSWTRNTLIKQGAKLVASWEDVWEDLPSQVRLQLEETRGIESDRSLLHLSCRTLCCEQKKLWCLRRYAPMSRCRSTSLLEKLETQLTSSEVFTALFELEMSGRMRCLPGRNYVRNL